MKLNLGWISDSTWEEQMLNSEKMQIERLSRDVNARPELAIFGTKQWMVERFAKLSELVAVLKESGRLEIRMEEPPFIQRHLFPLIHSGARALMYLVVAFQPDYFGMPISQLTFLETSVEGVFSSISFLRQSLSTKLIKDMFRIRNLFECMEIKSAISPPENPAEYKSNPRGMKVEVKDLTFRYGKEAPPVLKDINFTIEPGQIVSVVGYNGSGITLSVKILKTGKTTLIRLLTLLEKPTTGQILINDVDISEYDPKIVRANMSVLFQDFRTSPSHFTNVEKYSNLSVQDNIVIGDINTSGNLKPVMQAAKDSGAHDYIRTFEAFYETVLQKERVVYDFESDYIPHWHYIDTYTVREIPFMVKMLSDNLYARAKAREKLVLWGQKPEKKIDVEIPPHEHENPSETKSYRSLSGGQWQRIALARSFMKLKEADLLILDEPSSALDPQAEYQVFKSIMDLRKNKTTIYIVLLFDFGLTCSHIGFIRFEPRIRLWYVTFCVE
jgi:ABC-type multidrug transport system fused ATPase/permease subunit